MPNVNFLMMAPRYVTTNGGGRGRGWREQKVCSALLRAVEFYRRFAACFEEAEEGGGGRKGSFGVGCCEGCGDRLVPIMLC